LPNPIYARFRVARQISAVFALNLPMLRRPQISALNFT
jgi:hypothetical protein